MSRLGMKAKFRHYRPDPETGLASLIWAQMSEHHSEEFPLGEIIVGDPVERELIRAQLWTPNALVDEGEKSFLDVYLDDVAVLTSTFFRLYSDGAPAETDTLATLLNETSGSGYAGITITRGTDWSTPALDAGDGQSTTVTKTFSATGTWTAADELIWATVASGTGGLFLGFIALSTTRTLTNLDTLDVDLAVKLA